MINKDKSYHLVVFLFLLFSNVLINGIKAENYIKSNTLYSSVMSFEYQTLIDSKNNRIVNLKENFVKIENSKTGRIENINKLEQKVFIQENVRYLIQFDYDLNGEVIRIPKDCILEFKGGSLKNGTIIGMNTIVISEGRRIFTDIELGGSWSNDYLNVKWFGATGNGNSDDILNLQCAFDIAHNININVFIPRGVYNISKPLIIYGMSEKKSMSIYGEGTEKTIIQKNNNNSLVYDDKKINSVIIIDGDKSTTNKSAHYIHLSDFSINGKSTFDIKDKLIPSVCNSDYGIYMHYSTSLSSFERIWIKNCIKGGIYSNHNNYLNKYNQIRVSTCGVGFQINGGISTSNIYENCYVNTANVAYKLSGIYMQMSNCCADSVYETVFSLVRYNGTIISPGTESINAERTFEFGQSKVTIIGALTWGTENNDNYICIDAGAGSNIVCIGCAFMYNSNTSASNILGSLYQCRTQTAIAFYNCTSAKYAIPNEYNNINNGYNLANKQGYISRRENVSFVGSNSYSSDGYIDDGCKGLNIPTNAIYFGLGKDPYHNYDNVNLSRNAHNMQGDILLGRFPKETGGVGWVQAKKMLHSDNLKWNEGEYYKIPIVLSGTMNNLPTMSLCDGDMFYNTDFKVPIWYNLNEKSWKEADGSSAGVKRNGTFVDKPKDVYIGFMYFCIDRKTMEGDNMGIPIYHRGNNIWVDALGRTIK